MTSFEREAETYAEMTREALIIELLRLRIRLDAAHEQIGELKWETERREKR